MIHQLVRVSLWLKTMQPNEHTALLALKSKLDKTINLIDFRVFGSKATGDESPDSDIDVMIEVENYTPEVEALIDELVFEINIDYDNEFISNFDFNGYTQNKLNTKTKVFLEYDGFDRVIKNTQDYYVDNIRTYTNEYVSLYLNNTLSLIEEKTYLNYSYNENNQKELVLKEITKNSKKPSLRKKLQGRLFYTFLATKM